MTTTKCVSGATGQDRGHRTYLYDLQLQANADPAYTKKQVKKKLYHIAVLKLRVVMAASDWPL